MTSDELARRLRLVVITDEGLARPRSLDDLVAAAVEAGASAVQLRMKGASAREMFEVGQRILPVVRGGGALFFVNDRVDVALALDADGVHVGPNDMPVAAARRAVSAARQSPAQAGAKGATASPGTGGAGSNVARPFLIGASSDDPVVAATLVADGADYIGCGTVFPTTTKADAGEAIGLEGLQRVVDAVEVPVVGIGGIDAAGAARIAAETGAAGVAVVGAVMGADDVRRAVRALRAPWVGGR